MLVLMCTVGADRLAIPALQVAEVLPRVELHTLVGGPGWLAGYFDYRGRPTPVVNFGAAAGTIQLSHRIVLITLPGDSGNALVGLAVDDATTQTVDRLMDGSPKSRWGSLQLDDTGMYHLVEPRTLLSPLIQDGLLAIAEVRG